MTLLLEDRPQNQEAGRQTDRKFGSIREEGSDIFGLSPFPCFFQPEACRFPPSARNFLFTARSANNKTKPTQDLILDGGANCVTEISLDDRKGVNLSSLCTPGLLVQHSQVWMDREVELLRSTGAPHRSPGIQILSTCTCS